MHLKIIQRIPDQHTWKAGRKATAENSHMGHWADALRKVLL